LVVPHDLVLMAKVLGVALAVGLDVLAVSVGVGVMQLVLNVRLRLGFALAGSEIVMQVIGHELGAGAGKMLGEVATYVRIEHAGNISPACSLDSYLMSSIVAGPSPWLGSILNGHSLEWNGTAGGKKTGMPYFLSSS
jgi:hypothetical protein